MRHLSAVIRDGRRTAIVDLTPYDPHNAAVRIRGVAPTAILPHEWNHPIHVTERDDD